MVAGSSQIGEAIRELSTECGIEFDEENTAVIDHHQFDAKDEGRHTLVLAKSDDLIDAPVIIGNARKAKRPILFRGVGYVVCLII